MEKLKLSQKIRVETKSLVERKLPANSFFELEFNDKSKRSEHDMNWSDMSEETAVKYFGGNKVVMLSKQPVSKIKICHNDSFASLEKIQEGDRVYQAFRSRTIFLPGGRKIDKIIGRIIGIVRNGEVIEEKVIDIQTGEIMGIKK